ncbi:MAG TPA: hypothetical protein VJ796_12570 [Acidimicrobiia bacterium]|nr:hypothetical protein [Acidimicrobiia bacterium]
MIIPNGYGQINLIMTGDALPSGGQVTFGFENVADTATPQAVASGVSTILEGCTNIWASTWNEVRCTGILVKFGPNSTGPSALLGVTHVGAYSSTDGLPSAAYLIRKNTAMGGRQGRGRFYWPGLPLQDVNEAGVIQSNLLLDQSTGWTEFFTEMSAADWPLVLLRAEGSPLQTPEPLTGFSPQSVAGTQRRRLRR